MKRACLKWLLIGLAAALAAAKAGETPPKKPETGEDAPAQKVAASASSAAILSGLHWLDRHQDLDGHWATAGFTNRCDGKDKCSGKGKIPHDTGITALATLAMMEAGHLPESKSPFTGAVKKALDWLKAHQSAKGCFPPEKGEIMYDQAIATLALTEAARLAQSQSYKEAAQRGVTYLEKARNPGLAWRYEPRKGENDTSVTAWCMQAFAAAEGTKLIFDRTAAYQGVRTWLKKVTNPEGEVGYIAPGDKGSYIKGMNQEWKIHPDMTAAALYIRIVMDKKAVDPWMKTAAGMMAKDLPKWDDDEKTVDFYYWHYGALALCRFDGPKGPVWTAFKDSIIEALIPNQEDEKSGCVGGSWDPEVDKWGPAGGRVYATALNVLTLELIEKMK